MSAATTAHRLAARAHRGAAWCRRLAADVRAVQLATLQPGMPIRLGPADDQPADDTQAAGADEGAQPPTTAGAGLTPAQRAALAKCDDDRWLLWLAPVSLLAFLAYSALTAWVAA